MAAKAKTVDVETPGAVDASYDGDVVAWSIEQARLLRAGLFDQLDVEHIADEILDVGKSELRELASRVAVLLAHRLKWEFQPTHRSRSWLNTIHEQRRQIHRRLKRTPTLHRQMDSMAFYDDAWSDARVMASRETGIDITKFPTTCPWGVLDLLSEANEDEDWSLGHDKK